MKSFNVDDIINSMNGDKEFIEQREKERNERYRTAIDLYKRSIENEQRVLEQTKDKIDERNAGFKQQISDLFLRYQGGVIKIFETERRLMNEKQMLNEFLIKVYPNLGARIKEDLKKENEDIDKRLRIIEDEKNKKLNLEEDFNSRQNIYNGMENYNKVTNTRQFLEKNVGEIGSLKENYETNYNYLNQIDQKYKNYNLDRNAPRGLNNIGYNRSVQDYHQSGQDLIEEIKKKRERMQHFNENQTSTEEHKESPGPIKVQTNYLQDFIGPKGKKTERPNESITERNELDNSTRPEGSIFKKKMFGD